MEREREKLKRTVALQTQDHKAESVKESRRCEKQWQKVCGDLQKASGCEQVLVVRFQLELVRVLQAAREKEETLQRQASDALHECSVSTSFYHQASIITLLYACFYHQASIARFYTCASIITLLAPRYIFLRFYRLLPVSIEPFLFYDLRPFVFCSLPAL